MSRKTVLILGSLTGLALSSCFIFLPCIQVNPDGPYNYWIRSQNNLHTIGVAIHEYYEIHKCLPPAVVTDKEGRPLYSWRVLLLQYMETGEGLNFKLDEPWDSPHNKGLSESTPERYSMRFPYGPEDPPGTTRYQLFVGPGTAFERPGLKFEDITDGHDQTLLVVEAGEPVPWSKPADIIYDPKKPLPALGGVPSKPVYFMCWVVDHRPVFNALFVGGDVRRLDGTIDEKTLRALITRNGGEKVDLSKFVD